MGQVKGGKELYRYQPTPVSIAGQLVALSPSLELIAVSEDQTAYREITEDYLRGCRVEGGAYYCAKRNVLTYDHRDSCLSAIYFRNYETMRQECPLNLATEENYAIGVGPSRFVVSARSGIVARQTCFDRVERQIAITGRRCLVAHTVTQASGGLV